MLQEYGAYCGRHLGNSSIVVWPTKGNTAEVYCGRYWRRSLDCLPLLYSYYWIHLFYKNNTATNEKYHNYLLDISDKSKRSPLYKAYSRLYSTISMNYHNVLPLIVHQINLVLWNNLTVTCQTRKEIGNSKDPGLYFINYGVLKRGCVDCLYVNVLVTYLGWEFINSIFFLFHRLY